MAKSKKAKIKLAVPDNKVTLLPLVDTNELPTYKRYADCLNQTFRVFFEAPHSIDDVTDNKYPKKKYLRAGQYSKGNKNGFLLYQDGKELVGESIAKTFSQLIIKKLDQGYWSDGAVKNTHGCLHKFFSFLSSLQSPPSSFSDLSTSHFSEWFDSFPSSRAKDYKSNITAIIKTHPKGHLLNLGSIKIKEKDASINDLTKVDFDKITGEEDYSDKELIQILAYVYFEIETSKEHYSGVNNTTIESLGNDYIAIKDINVNNRKINEFLESGVDGYNKLIANMYFHIKNEKNGIRGRPSKSDCEYFIARIRTVTERVYKNRHNPFGDFLAHLHSLAWPLTTKGAKKIEYVKYLSQISNHHETAILLYVLITTGLNLETILSWKYRVNNRPWFEIFDVALGVVDSTPLRDKSVLLSGIKQKGKGASKIIQTSININSPLFSYLKYLDETRSQEREYIFNISEVNQSINAFAANYKIIDDNGNHLKSILTKRIRKVFAGHKLMTLLKDVKNADELVEKLRDALNHNKFDTTLFSYILKGGVGNLIINSAIVALTSDMIEKSMRFQGEIKEDSERTKETKKVFLCDCSDPSNPTHNLPIADVCKKYDMCLGCKRSEVYVEHLPAICYRLMQYEDKRISDPELFKITLEDRLHIARDTIEQFKVRHKNGLSAVESAYKIANNAITNNTPLLPPILQFGSL